MSGAPEHIATRRSPGSARPRGHGARWLLALLLSAGLGGAQAQGEGTRAPGKPVPPDPIRFTPSCVDPDRTITIAAVGDVLLHDSLQRWAALQPEGFLAAMRNVGGLLRAADVAVANLEGAAAEGVTGGGRRTAAPASRYDGVVYSGYPMFNAHPSVIGDLKALGVDVLQTANNHALDRGALGADLTLEAIRAAGLASTGTRHRATPEAPWHAVHEVTRGGQRHALAFLACTYGTNGLPDRARQVLNCFEHKAEMLAQIRQLAARADLHAVIVLPHWGHEYQHKADPVQKALAREFVDAGATAVIGTHPHVIQPIEKRLATDGRETVIAYSLGNFVSHQIGLPRLSSVVLLLGLAPDGRGKLTPTALGWVPLRMRVAGGFSVDPVDQIDSRDGAPFREHLLSLLPAENLHPPQAPFWAQRHCAPSGQRSGDPRPSPRG